jgi:DNA-binding transcriptional LysR family regulator
MAAQPLLCVGEHINPGFYRSVLAAFVAVGITPPIVQQANSLVVLSLVETGMVIGIVSSALRWRITPHLLMRRVEEFLPSTSVDLVWRRNDKSGVLGSFVDCATAGLMERGKVTAAESRDQEACRPDLAWTFANSSAILKATGRWHEEQGNAEP